MPVPDYQSFFRPLLEFAADGKEHSMREARDALTVSMKITEQDLQERLPSGTQRTFDNRLAWAKTYLAQAKTLDTPRRGVFRITERGRKLLQKHSGQIDKAVLEQYEEFRSFQSKESAVPRNQPEVQTPEEVFQKAIESIKAQLAADLLERIKKNSPLFFERLVVDLMLTLGYGGSRSDAGQAIGHSGDEGIDGIIKEDRLGLDVIYLQAKRWDGVVGRPEIQKFVGALQGRRARKGVFITTGKFSGEAIRYAEAIESKVVLIDGEQLADLMIEHNVGVSSAISYNIKRVDSDYFDEQ
jgi:restriction system protein